MKIARSTKHLRWLLAALLLFAVLPALGSPAATLPAPMSDARWGIERCPGNVAIFRFINDHHAPAADRVAYFMDTLGIDFKKHHLRIDLGIGWVLVPVFLFAWFRRRHLFATLVIGMAVETLIIVVLKHFFDQPRPGVLLAHVHQVIHLRGGSFPSGHTAMGCIIAGVMMYRRPWWEKSLWVLFAAVIAYQRLYAGVHFPLDVFVGMLIGVVSVAIAFAIMKKRVDRAMAMREERTRSITQQACSTGIIGS